jgi:MoaA/NifB/PqqE/SkfB family radical SAM enzyme
MPSPHDPNPAPADLASPQARANAKFIINLSYRCNNRCVFCSVADRARVDGDLAAQLALIRSARAEGVGALDLDGGEPLLYRHLFPVLKAAVAEGLRPITITTNGRMLAYEALAARLARVPGLAVLVSLHSHVAATHDALTRAPGSHAQTLAGLRNAVARLPHVGVNMTLTAHNWQDAPGMVRLARDEGAASLSLQYYTPFGEVDAALAPPAACADAVRAAVAARGELPVNLVNFVQCLAPELAEYMAGDWFKEVRRMMFVSGEVVNLAEFLGQRRYKDARCAGCTWGERCRGFWEVGP